MHVFDLWEEVVQVGELWPVVWTVLMGNTELDHISSPVRFKHASSINVYVNQAPVFF